MVELDKSRSTGKRLGGGAGGLFSSSNPDAVPKELLPIATPQQTISKLVLSTRTSVNAANQDYEKLTDPSLPTPSAPVHAARLNGLLKTLANAEGAVAESIKARKLLIEGLEKILDTNRTALAGEESQLALISQRRTDIDSKKRDVEDSIMRGFANNSDPTTPVGDGSPGIQGQHSPVTPAAELDRPEVEALTPPGYPQPPVTEPVPDFNLNTNGNGNGEGHASHVTQPPTAGLDLLSSLSTSYARPSSAKKRKLSSANDFPDLGGDELDADVAEMLRQG